MAPDTHPRLVIIVPTRGRPKSLPLLIKAFRRTTPVGYRMLLVVDPDDRASWDAVPVNLPDVEVLKHMGDSSYPAKINAGIAATDESLIQIGADDVLPRDGWFEEASSHMDERVGYVSLNDLGNGYVMNGVYATHPLIARWYIDRYGPVYDEKFRHNGCDVDASLRAQDRGAFAYAPRAVMEHLHPHFGKGDMDDTYRVGGMNEAGVKADMERLRSLWGVRLEELGIG